MSDEKFNKDLDKATEEVIKKEEVATPRLIIDYQGGKVLLSGQIPDNPVIAFGMLERARFILNQFYFQRQALRDDLIAKPINGKGGGFMKKMFNIVGGKGVRG